MHVHVVCLVMGDWRSASLLWYGYQTFTEIRMYFLSLECLYILHYLIKFKIFHLFVVW